MLHSDWEPFMLILTRRTGETLRIGDDVEVTVMAVNGRRFASASRRPATSPSIVRKSPSASSANDEPARSSSRRAPEPVQQRS